MFSLVDTRLRGCDCGIATAAPAVGAFVWGF